MINVELLLCICAIYGCFLSWGILQETVTTTPYFHANDLNKTGQSVKFKDFMFLNFVQSICASLVAYFYLRIRGMSLGDPSKELLLQISKVSFLSSIASPFGYASLKHIDYPTMILGKSCKLLPVLLMAFVLHRKIYEAYKYVSVFLITFGVSLFTFSQPVKNTGSVASNSLFGLLLLTINLLLDGATNSTQDHIFTKFKVNGPQMMCFMSFFSALLMFIYLQFITPFLRPDGLSELYTSISFAMDYPSSFKDVLSFGMVGALGQVVIFHTLERFGSLVLVTVTVTRKMFSMILSVFYFGHVLSFGQWIAVLIVFGGILFETIMSKSSKGKKPKEKKEEESVFIEGEKIDKKDKTSLKQRNNKK